MVVRDLIPAVQTSHSHYLYSYELFFLQMRLKRVDPFQNQSCYVDADDVATKQVVNTTSSANAENIYKHKYHVRYSVQVSSYSVAFPKLNLVSLFRYAIRMKIVIINISVSGNFVMNACVASFSPLFIFSEAIQRLDAYGNFIFAVDFQ